MNRPRGDRLKLTDPQDLTIPPESAPRTAVHLRTRSPRRWLTKRGEAKIPFEAALNTKDRSLTATTRDTSKIEPKTDSVFEHTLYPRADIHADAGKLARFLTELRYEAIPDNVVQTAKAVTLDTLGCIIAGTDTPLGNKILEAYKGGLTTNGCRIPGTSYRTSPSVAAKVNAWLSDVLDYEDVAVGHPSATVIPASLAMAEHVQATPKQFLTGVIAGYEAGLRVHDATQASPEVYRRFAVYHAWHGIAAGAAAMAVSGGTDEQFRSALGHAAANTNVPLWYVQYGRPAHDLKANYGQMARGGVDAALCAHNDIIGPFSMLSDAERGFAYQIGSDNFEPSHLSADLGTRWRTSETALKPYPSCGFFHTSIEAAATLVNEHRIDYLEVSEVRVQCFSRITEWLSDVNPTTPIDAQLSIEYVSAMALLSKEPGREWFSPSTMAHPDLPELMKKIKIEVDPIAEQEFWNNGQYMSTVTIRLQNGTTYSRRVDWPSGHWRRPFSDSDLERKFLGNIRGTAVESHGTEIMDRVMNLELSDSMDPLLSILGAARV